MRLFRASVVVVLILISPLWAFAGNEKGHYVVCRLAWLQMTEQQRAAVTAILKKHPHYDEYLAKQKPDGFTVDEWAFMRAGAWADWVRSGSARSYGHSTWHYVNYPVCFPGLGESEDKHQPPAAQENAVWAMNRCLAMIRTGSDEEKAVYLTWLCHLLGDIHQPLHCVALYSDKYPDGDRGGNAIRIRISSSPTNLHSFWDGLLGRGTTAGSIAKDVAEIQTVMKEKAEALRADLDTHTTPDSWAQEGAELARHTVYLNGELLMLRAGSTEDVIQAPPEYASACGRAARVQVGKAGTRLAKKLRKLLTPPRLPTQRDFDRIRLGMTYTEAEEILGDCGANLWVSYSSGRGTLHNLLYLGGVDDSILLQGIATVTFHGDLVVEKQSRNLSLVEKLKLWWRGTLFNFSHPAGR